ncbi:hypothetical protein C4K18_4034 [Pseudomonas chlororaphis subsp. aurantiaca]|nr:hypothetical protein C4K18_4034 [Pseudomonas chlororaphis subsp. aurantiaca]
MKPDDAVCLVCGGVWLGARCAGDRSLALARQRLQDIRSRCRRL